MTYKVRFADDVDAHLHALTAQQKAAIFEGIERQLLHEPLKQTRNRKPMSPAKQGFVAPWELRLEDLRVYYDVEEKEEPAVVIVAVGVKIRERVRIGGKDLQP